jgi:hypothetical protein
MFLLFALDRLLLETTERSAHRFQRWTGKNNFWWMRQLLVIQALCLLAVAVEPLYLSTLPWASRITLSLLLLVMVMFLGVTGRLNLASQLDHMEGEAYKRLQQGLANPEKIHPAYFVFRLVTLFVFMPIVLLMGVSYHINIIVGLATVALAYLSACDPLPPCAGKIKEWWLSLRAAPKLQESTTN